MRLSRLRSLIVPPCLAACFALVVAPATGRADDRTETKPTDKALQVLVFSGAGWYRHPEIPRTNG
jgi:hypothetical protein